jgi:hypothetical protein
VLELASKWKLAQVWAILLMFPFLVLVNFAFHCSYPPAPGSGISERHAEEKTTDHHDDGGNDQQSAQTLPLVLHQQSPGENGVSAEPKNKGCWYSNPDWWIAGFTGFLFFATTGLWYFTAMMWKATTKAANAAQVAAEAIPIMERPYIFIHGIHSLINQTDPQRRRVIQYSVSNNGKLTAKVKDVRIACGLEKFGKYPPLVIQGDHLLLQVPILSANQERMYIKYEVDPWSMDSAGELLDGVIFRVVIFYRGPFPKQKQFAQDFETSYAVRYQKGMSGLPTGFAEIETPQYTYEQ